MSEEFDRVRKLELDRAYLEGFGDCCHSIYNIWRVKENEFHDRVVNSLSRQEYELYLIRQNAPAFYGNEILQQNVRMQANLQENPQDLRALNRQRDEEDERFQQNPESRNPEPQIDEKERRTIDSSPSTGVFSEEENGTDEN